MSIFLASARSPPASARQRAHHGIFGHPAWSGLPVVREADALNGGPKTKSTEFVHAARKRPAGQANDPLTVIWRAGVFVSRRANAGRPVAAALPGFLLTPAPSDALPLPLRKPVAGAALRRVDFRAIHLRGDGVAHADVIVAIARIGPPGRKV